MKNRLLFSFVALTMLSALPVMGQDEPAPEAETPRYSGLMMLPGEYLKQVLIHPDVISAIVLKTQEMGWESERQKGRLAVYFKEFLDDDEPYIVKRQVWLNILTEESSLDTSTHAVDLLQVRVELVPHQFRQNGYEIVRVTPYSTNGFEVAGRRSEARNAHGKLFRTGFKYIQPQLLARLLLHEGVHERLGQMGVGEGGVKPENGEISAVRKLKEGFYRIFIGRRVVVPIPSMSPGDHRESNGEPPYTGLESFDVKLLGGSTGSSFQVDEVSKSTKTYRSIADVMGIANAAGISDSTTTLSQTVIQARPILDRDVLMERCRQDEIAAHARFLADQFAQKVRHNNYYGDDGAADKARMLRTIAVSLGWSDDLRAELQDPQFIREFGKLDVIDFRIERAGEIIANQLMRASQKVR